MNLSPLLPSILAFALAIALAGCEQRVSALDPDPGMAPRLEIEREQDGVLIRVDRPEQFPLVAATSYAATPSLEVTGVVTADVSRSVPVVSMSSGRIVEIRVRLGDTVRKGQLLMRV